MRPISLLHASENPTPPSVFPRLPCFLCRRPFLPLDLPLVSYYLQVWQFSRHFGLLWWLFSASSFPVCVCVRVCLSVSIFVSLSVCLLLCPFTCPLSVCSSPVCTSIRPYVGLFMFVCPFVRSQASRRRYFPSTKTYACWLVLMRGILILTWSSSLRTSHSRLLSPQYPLITPFLPATLFFFFLPKASNGTVFLGCFNFPDSHPRQVCTNPGLPSRHLLPSGINSSPCAPPPVSLSAPPQLSLATQHGLKKKALPGFQIGLI